MKSLQVGSKLPNLGPIISVWSKHGTLEKSCSGETCYYFIRSGHLLPSVLRGDSEQLHKNWIAGLIDHTGLRSSAIGAEIRTEGGVIIQKSFMEDVALPVRDWYLREGAYVPDLAVYSGENTEFPDYWRVNPEHPFRYARRQKGLYGLIVDFTSNESAPEKEELMHFRFSCITSFRPCRNESEILAEGARLLENHQ